MARRIKAILLACVAAAALLFGSHASAHHSFASTYSEETVTIEGRVVEFLFRNPHSAVLLETATGNKPPVLWVAEWMTAGQLSREGIEKNTIQPGDRVIVTGNPSRNSADHRMRLGKIVRPANGWSWKGDF